MDSVSSHNFGPAIAYLIPGATLLAGLQPFSPTVDHWLATSTDSSPTFSGFVYLSVVALALGMTISAVRWALIDRIHAFTGLAAPPLNFARLQDNVEAISLLIEIHYRHYQFHANMGSHSATAPAARFSMIAQERLLPPRVNPFWQEP